MEILELSSVEISVENVDNFLHLKCGIELCQGKSPRVKVCAARQKCRVCRQSTEELLEEDGNSLSKKWGIHFIFGVQLQAVITGGTQPDETAEIVPAPLLFYDIKV